MPADLTFGSAPAHVPVRSRPPEPGPRSSGRPPEGSVWTASQRPPDAWHARDGDRLPVVRTWAQGRAWSTAIFGASLALPVEAMAGLAVELGADPVMALGTGLLLTAVGAGLSVRLPWPASRPVAYRVEHVTAFPAVGPLPQKVKVTAVLQVAFALAGAVLVLTLDREALALSGFAGIGPLAGGVAGIASRPRDRAVEARTGGMLVRSPDWRWKTRADRRGSSPFWLLLADAPAPAPEPPAPPRPSPRRVETRAPAGYRRLPGT